MNIRALSKRYRPAAYSISRKLNHGEPRAAQQIICCGQPLTVLGDRSKGCDLICSVCGKTTVEVKSSPDNATTRAESGIQQANEALEFIIDVCDTALLFLSYVPSSETVDACHRFFSHVRVRAKCGDVTSEALRGRGKKFGLIDYCVEVGNIASGYKIFDRDVTIESSFDGRLDCTLNYAVRELGLKDSIILFPKIAPASLASFLITDPLFFTYGEIERRWNEILDLRKIIKATYIFFAFDESYLMFHRDFYNDLISVRSISKNTPNILVSENNIDRSLLKEEPIYKASVGGVDKLA